MPSARLGPWKADDLGKFLVLRRDGSMPEWTWFVLGALDPAAPAACAEYARRCPIDTNNEYVKDVEQLASTFEVEREARAAAGAKKGDPDAGRHRPDNALILMLMRGEITFADLQLTPFAQARLGIHPAL